MGKNSFKIGSIEIGLGSPFFAVAGPCVIEGERLCLEIAATLVEISSKTDVPIIFKASFDKANRSSAKSFRGPGLRNGLKILAAVRRQTGLAVMTDVHETSQVDPVAAVVDCLQIPAFLCRQTDLICACARSGKAINVKKGQFLSPAEMKNVVDKARACGCRDVLLTERGTFFGYNRLVNDMTAIEQMKQLGVPVLFDATHSTQQPGGLGDASAGQRQMAPVLAKAAVAAGANGLFLEVHPRPDKAKSDAACVMPIEWVPHLLSVCKEIFELVQR